MNHNRICIKIINELIKIQFLRISFQKKKGDDEILFSYHILKNYRHYFIVATFELET